MARISKIAQLFVSLAVLGLFWRIYPGVMVLFASAIGLIYVAASICALRGCRLANQVAIAFSAATAILATLAVLRFARSGFSYATGNYEWHDGVYWTPYAFLAVAAGAALVVVLHLALWRSANSRESQS